MKKKNKKLYHPQAEETMEYFRKSLTTRYDQWLNGALTDRVYYFGAGRLSESNKVDLVNKGLPPITRDKIQDIVLDTLAYMGHKLPEYNVAATGKEDLFIAKVAKLMLDRVINISNGEYLVKQAMLDAMVQRGGIILPYFDEEYSDGEFTGEVKWKRIDRLSVIVDENCTDPWWNDAQYLIIPFEVTKGWLIENYGKEAFEQIENSSQVGDYKTMVGICHDMKINRESGVLGKIYNKTESKIDRYFLMDRYSRDGQFWVKYRSVGSILLEDKKQIKVRHCPAVNFIWTNTGNPFSQGLVQELRPSQVQYDYNNRIVNKLLARLADPPVLYTRHNIPNDIKKSEWAKDLFYNNTAKEYVPDPVTGLGPQMIDKTNIPPEVFTISSEVERDMRMKAGLKPILQGDKGSIGRLESFGDVNKILETALIPLHMRGESRDVSMKILYENTLELMVATSWATQDRMLRILNLNNQIEEVIVNPKDDKVAAGVKTLSLKNMYFDIQIQNQGTKATLKQELFSLIVELYKTFPPEWRDLEFLMQYSPFENTDQYLKKVNRTGAILAENTMLKKQLSMAFKVVSYITNREVSAKVAAKVAAGGNQILNDLNKSSIQLSKIFANPEGMDKDMLSKAEQLLEKAKQVYEAEASLQQITNEPTVTELEMQAMTGSPLAAQLIDKQVGTQNMPQQGTNQGPQGVV